MRNHDEKARDMARSPLPSTARVAARKHRATVHGRERAYARIQVAELRRFADPDDFEGDLTWQDRADLEHMVGLRRMYDNVAALIHWATRTIATDPQLRAATPHEQLTYFGCRMPEGMLGRHALIHLARMLDPDHRRSDL